MSPESLKNFESERKSKRRSQSSFEVKAKRGWPFGPKLTDVEKKQKIKEKVSKYRKRKQICVIRQKAINKRWGDKKSERNTEKNITDSVEIPSCREKKRFGKRNISIRSVLLSDINEGLDVLVLTIKTQNPILFEQINSASEDLGIIINNDLLQKYKQPHLSKISRLQKYRKKQKVNNIIDKIHFNLKPYAITSTIKRLLLSSETSDINEKIDILKQNGINVY